MSLDAAFNVLFAHPLGALHYLVFAFVFFALGLFAVTSAENLVKTVIGVAFMFNAIALNFAAVNVYCIFSNHLGQIFSIFIVLISFIQLFVAILLVFAAFRKLKTLDVKDYKTLAEEV